MRHDENPDDFCYKNAVFQHVLIQNTPFIGTTMNTGPLASISDGFNDLIVQRTTAGKCGLAKVLIDEDEGKYFDKKGGIRRDLGIEYTKCRAWRIDPLIKGPPPEKESVALS